MSAKFPRGGGGSRVIFGRQSNKPFVSSIEKEAIKDRLWRAVIVSHPSENILNMLLWVFFFW